MGERAAKLTNRKVLSSLPTSAACGVKLNGPKLRLFPCNVHNYSKVYQLNITWPIPQNVSANKNFLNSATFIDTGKWEEYILLLYNRSWTRTKVTLYALEILGDNILGTIAVKTM